MPTGKVGAFPPGQHPHRASLGGEGLLPLGQAEEGRRGTGLALLQGNARPFNTQVLQQLPQLQLVLQLPPKPFSSSPLKAIVFCVGLLVGLGW